LRGESIGADLEIPRRLGVRRSAPGNRSFRILGEYQSVIPILRRHLIVGDTYLPAQTFVYFYFAALVAKYIVFVCAAFGVQGMAGVIGNFRIVQGSGCINHR